MYYVALALELLNISLHPFFKRRSKLPPSFPYGCYVFRKDIIFIIYPSKKYQ